MNKQNKQNKREVVLVTGAGRGIGAAIAKKFIEQGYDVILNYRRSYGKGAAHVEHLLEYARQCGVKAIKVRADIAETREVNAMMEEIEKAGITQIDHLILNAATATFRRFNEMTKNDWKVLLGTNLIGNVACVNRVAPLMPVGGTICAISSLGSRMVFDRYPLGVMKAAVEHLIRYLAVELRGQKVRVNGVCAGFTDTDMVSLLLDLWPDVAEKTSNSDDKWLLDPEEVANVVAFLASPMASAINGEIVVADAGFSIGIGSAAHTGEDRA